MTQDDIKVENTTAAKNGLSMLTLALGTHTRLLISSGRTSLT